MIQFLAVYNAVKDVANDDLFWGDELEYAVLELQGEGSSPERTVKLAVGAGAGHMDTLKALEQARHNRSVNGCAWHQEYGSWMLEGTPQLPYSGWARDLVEVEINMRLRRARLLGVLAPGQIAPTCTNFPLLGTPGFTQPPLAPGGASSLSGLVPDQCINPHPRFGTLTANIRSRRGGKVDIRMPLFRDARTPEFAEGAPPPPVEAEPLPFHLAHVPKGWPLVRGDCMAFGMGSCCLQVTRAS